MGAIAAGDVTLGTVFAPRVVSGLTLTDIVRYQGASGDLNPVHHDAEYAQARGYPGPFSVGMLPAGILGSYVADIFGASSVRRFSTRFVNIVWPGDDVICAVEVESIEHLGPTEVDVHLKLGVTNGVGLPVISGRALVRLDQG